MVLEQLQTPIGSDNSICRKSIAIKKPRGCLVLTVNDVVIVNDDEAERALRRSSLELRRRVSNIGTLKKSTSATRGIGNTSSDSCSISEDSIEDHYQTCVKLFTENKINSKNAWSLHIIECMRAMMSKGLVMRETLKLATTSLDIGSKVYGLRVDDIHHDMFKLASSMARINIERDDDIVEDEGYCSRPGTQEVAAKKKPEKKKLTEELTIAKDPSSLNGKITPHKTKCVGATSTTQDRLYTLSSLSKQKFGWEQLVNCRTNFQYWTSLKDDQSAPHSTTVAITVPSMDGTVCPPFGDSMIDRWTPDDDNVPYGSQYSGSKGDEVIYDENGFPIPELDDDHFDEPFEQGGDDIVGNRQSGIRKPVTFITSMRPGDGPLSDKPLQYSYRAVPAVRLTGVWAGPSHWKIKSLQRPSAQPTRKTIQRAPQRGRRLPTPVTFFEDDFEERLMEGGKQFVRLQNYKQDKYVLPEDQCFSEAYTKTFCMRPWLYAEVRKVESKQNENVNLSMSTIYRYENPNDAEYCSQTTNDEDSGADTGRDAEAVLEGDHLGGDENHDDPNNMVSDDVDATPQVWAAPNTVPTIKVPYAIRAKKIDMKKLKHLLWNTMAILETGSTSVFEDEQMLNNLQFHEVKFSETYTILLSFLPYRMTEELSYPMAFVALLHLTNEQNLHLEGQSDLLDFKISKK